MASCIAYYFIRPEGYVTVMRDSPGAPLVNGLVATLGFLAIELVVAPSLISAIRALSGEGMRTVRFLSYLLMLSGLAVGLIGFVPPPGSAIGSPFAAAVVALVLQPIVQIRSASSEARLQSLSRWVPVGASVIFTLGVVIRHWLSVPLGPAYAMHVACTIYALIAATLVVAIGRAMRAHGVPVAHARVAN